jgi:hypothetical protein
VLLVVPGRIMTGLSSQGIGSDLPARTLMLLALGNLVYRWRAEGLSEACLAAVISICQGYVETWARAETATSRLRQSEASAK